MTARIGENRANTGLGHPAGRLERRFIVRNYETYNPARATSRANIKRSKKRRFIRSRKEDTHVRSGDGQRVSQKILFEKEELCPRLVGTQSKIFHSDILASKINTRLEEHKILVKNNAADALYAPCTSCQDFACFDFHSFNTKYARLIWIIKKTISLIQS